MKQKFRIMVNNDQYHTTIGIEANLKLHKSSHTHKKNPDIR